MNRQPGPFTIALRLAVITASLVLLEKIGRLLFLPLFQVTSFGVWLPGEAQALPGLFVAALVQACIASLVAYRSALSGMRLALRLALVFFGIRQVLNLIEALVFLQNLYPVSNQLAEFFGSLVPSLGLGILCSWMWKNKVAAGQGEAWGFVFRPRFLLTSLYLLLVWYGLYLAAGTILVMPIPEVVTFYYGVSDISSLAASPDAAAGGAMDFSAVPLGYLLQIPRAGIWIFLTLVLLSLLKGDWWERSLIVGLTFGLIMASDLLPTNPIMPDIVRLAHFPEILVVNLLWGVILSWSLKQYFVVKGKRST